VADFNYQLGSGGKNTKLATWVGGIVACLFAIPFAAAGLFVIWQGIKKITRGETGQGIGIVAFGMVFAAVGFGLMYAAITAGRRQRQAEEKWKAQTDGGNKVWLARDDWAAGKIKSSSAAQTKILLIFALAFGCFGTAMSIFVLPKELHGGNDKALAILLFPAVGIICAIAVVRSFLSRRRFGDCWFELAQVPAPLGGSLDGLIQTERPLHLEQGLHLKLSCINRTVSGSGDNRSVQENILWQNEKVFRPDAALPSTGVGGSGIPVHFDLPANQPEASLRGNSTVIWRLEARAKMAGPDFTALFEVPVFRVAGFVPTRSAEPDPTAPLQMSAEEIRRDEHSRIQVNDVPGGREFYFPAARNIGTAFFTTLFMVVFNGVAVVTFHLHAPILFPIVFGLIGVLLIFGTFNLWFKSVRVTINSTNVRVHNRWLIFSRTREFSAGDYSRFTTKMGMQSGSTVFTDIKLVRAGADAEFAQEQKKFQNVANVNQLAAQRLRQVAGPRGVTVASSIANSAEAEWLVGEMNRALGRK
jgi:hypothetical protein